MLIPVLSVYMHLPMWFGYIKNWTPVLHTDDHRGLARRALRYLARERFIAGDSLIVRYAPTIAGACGFLDMFDREGGGRSRGKLRWEYSHFYDPVEERGVNDRRYANALEEFRDFWARSLVHFRIENHERAFTFLGFCCHLLQDMAVPAHTHCVPHGLKARVSDNLELLSRARRYYLREPVGPPYRGEESLHEKLFVAMGVESRGREAFGPEESNEIAEILAKYYEEPRRSRGRWLGAYIGEPYYPYHRLLPSSPHIEWADMVELRNYLMERAASRSAQLLLHFSDVTGAGE